MHFVNISNINSKHNISLLEGDSIIVPKKLDLVQITGDLNNIDGNSISVPFLGLRAHYYVNNFAGGFTKHNVKENTLKKVFVIYIIRNIWHVNHIIVKEVLMG